MIANKVYTCAEMREERIYTGDYEFIKEAGEYIATLTVEGRNNPSTDDRSASFFVLK